MQAHCGNKLVNLVISTTFALLLLLLLVDASDHDTTPKHKTTTEKLMNRELSFEIILHGFLLWVSMGLLMPVGILTIRACSKQDCGRRLNKIVFYSHVTLQMLAIVLATAGAIMSIKNFENAFNNNHQKVGLVLYGMAWLQPLLGYCRPQRGSKGRSGWFFVHWFLGTGTSILGIINIYTGLQAYHKKTGTSVTLWTLLFTAQVSVMAFLYLFQDKWDYMKKQGVISGNIEPITPTSTTGHPQHYSSKDTQQELNAPCLEAMRV